MKAQIYKFLDIEHGEGSRVWLLLGMGFFMGVFIASFSVAAQALFLEYFDEQTQLPKALLYSGALGLLLITVYNFFQNRIPFVILSTFSILLVTAITAFIEFGGEYFGDDTEIFFYGFVAFFPVVFLVPLIFWGTFTRMFNLRQAKRLVGTADFGMMIAQFFILLLIPQFLDLEWVETDTLYTVCLGSISMFLVTFLVIYFRFLKERSLSQERKLYKKITPVDFVRNRYIWYLALFMVVSVMPLYFINYSFLNVTEGYIKDPKALASFISYFEMTVIVFGFLFDLTASDRILKEYGMRVAMLINPVLIMLFTVSAVVLGFAFGYSPTDNLFVIFFMVIAVSKLLVESMREVMDEKIFKLYLLPIDSEIRIDVQTKIEGVIASLAIFTAGGLIILLNQAGFSLIYMSIFTLPLLVVWYYIVNKMHVNYRSTLQRSLARGKEKSANKREREYALSALLEKEVSSTAEEKVVYGLKLMEKLEPALFENALIRLSNSESRKIKAFAQEKIELLGIQKEYQQSEVRDLAKTAVSTTEDSDLLSISPDKLIRLSKSGKQSDRMLAVKLLRKLISPKTIFVLLELLRDVDPKVRFEALFTARKVKRPETWSVLIELLGSPSYSHQAAAALKEAGEKVLPTLEAAFHKSGQTDLVMLRIVQIMGKIGGPQALQLLWRKADYPDKRIVKQILYSLRYINYQATGREVREVMSLLETEMSKTIWNLAALHELPEENKEFQFLRQALQEEVLDNYDQIFVLLSILYDPHSVQLVRENIESGDPDNIAYAMELLDLFIDQELKPKILPLLDESSTPEKLKQLQIHFPRENYTPIQVINYILNRDYNFNNRWTKVCAIHASAFISDFRISRGLVAQMFNTDRLLQETAAWVIYNKDKKLYEQIGERLPARDKKFLDSSIENNQLLDGLDDGFFLFIEMVMFIKETLPFRNIHGLLLSDLADKIIPVDLETGEKIKFNIEDPNSPVFMVAHGEVNLHTTDASAMPDTFVLKRGDVYGELFQNGAVHKVSAVEARERSIVFKINLMDFYFVLANHHELVHGLIKNVTEDETVSS